MAELVANCPRCGAREITVDVEELNFVEKEFDWLKTYEAFAVFLPPTVDICVWQDLTALPSIMDRAGAAWPVNAI